MMTTAKASEDTRAHGDLWKYRTIDLLVVVAVGIAFGVAFRGYGFLYTVLDPITTAYKPAQGLLAGIWFLPALIAGLIVRRPGAALLAEIIAAFLEMLLGGQWGLGTLISGLLQGGGVELAFVLTAYRRFTLPISILGSVLAAFFEWIYEWYAYYAAFSIAQSLALLGFFIISSIILCAVLGWFITQQLARTGALDSLPAGRDRRMRSLA